MAEHTKRKPPGGEGQAVEVGGPAPDFTLRRTFEESVSLSKLNAAGPVLVVFYVFDFGHV